MNETKFEPFKKAVAVACVLMACGIMSSMCFAPEQMQNEYDAEPCAYFTLPTPEYTPATPYSKNEIANEDVAETSPVEVVEEESESLSNPYKDLIVTDAEKELLACMAYSEAGNQCFEGQVAVVQVALNRYMHDAFSGSISEILLAPNQFAVGNYYNPEQMEAVEAALSGNPALDLNTDVVFFSTGALTYGSYYKTIEDHVFRTYT